MKNQNQLSKLFLLYWVRAYERTCNISIKAYRKKGAKSGGAFIADIAIGIGSAI